MREVVKRGGRAIPMNIFFGRVAYWVKVLCYKQNVLNSNHKTCYNIASEQ